MCAAQTGVGHWQASAGKEARKYDVAMKKISSEDYGRVARDYGCTVPTIFTPASATEVCGAAGARQAAPTAKLEPVQARVWRTPSSAPWGGFRRAIQVDGHDDLMVYRAQMLQSCARRGNSLAISRAT